MNVFELLDEHYNMQQGGKYEENKKWLENWYQNRKIPNQDIQNLYEEDKDFYIDRMKKVPEVTNIDLIDNNIRVTGQYQGDTNKILMTPNAQNSVYLHETNHYANYFPSAMRTVHDNIVEQNMYRKDDERLPKNLAENYDYFRNPDEIHSRIMVLRKDMGVKPDENISHEKLMNYLQNYKGDDENILQIMNLTDDRGLLEMLNFMAVNDKKQSAQVQVAQQGGKINYTENEKKFLEEVARLKLI